MKNIKLICLSFTVGIYHCAIRRWILCSAVVVCVAGCGSREDRNSEILIDRKINRMHYLSDAEKYYKKAELLREHDIYMSENKFPNRSSEYHIKNGLRRSEKWYRKAMRSRHPEAHYTFAVFVMASAKKNGIRKAIPILKEGAELGIPKAMIKYASFAIDEKLITEREYMVWLNRAANTGHAESIIQLGIHVGQPYYFRDTRL